MSAEMMSAEMMFTLVNAFVLPFWILLLVAPFARVTRWLVHSGLVPVVLGVVYTAFIVISMLGDPPEGAGMQSLSGLQAAFSDERALIGAWVHYLVFDLFVGAWIIRDAKRAGIPHLAVVVPAILTFVLGPLGLLLYMLLRAVWKRQFSLIETTFPGETPDETKAPTAST